MSLSTNEDFLSIAFSSVTGVNITTKDNYGKKDFKSLLFGGSSGSNTNIPSVDLDSLHKHSLQWDTSLARKK